MFDALLTQLLHETTQTSLRIFSPELALSAGMVLMLFGRLLDLDRLITAHWIALWSSLIAFMMAAVYYHDFIGEDYGAIEYFSGLLVFDRFAAVFRLGLLLFLVLVITLTTLSGIPDDEDAPDFYTLLLGSAVGMLLMGGANHLLMVFLGVEMSSVPSYVLAGFQKGRRQSSEAALKFVIYGAGSAGVMLYGISLLCGLLGTAELPEVALRLQALFEGSPATLANPLVVALTLALVLVFAGLAFKLSVVPFHFWTPDAFQGASAEVGGYLSVASKAAAFVLLTRIVLAFEAPKLALELGGTYLTLGVGLGLVAAVTTTFGNLAAYAQTNMKRLLAYSTIAHAGYMLMGIAALMVLRTEVTIELADRSTRAVEGLLYYLAVYLFMNLGAFAITALIRNEIFSEEIDDYAGLGFQAPILAIGMSICLFSLVGLPPLGGFVGKLFVFSSVYDAGFVHPVMWGVLVLGGLNTVFSLFYYARVLRIMFLVERPAHRTQLRVPTWSTRGGLVMILTIPIILMGVSVQVVSQAARLAAASLFQ